VDRQLAQPDGAVSPVDRWGVPIQGQSEQAALLFSEATADLVLLRGLPSADLEQAIETDPSAPLPRIARALLDLFAQTAVGRRAAIDRLEGLEAMIEPSSTRERLHLQAALAWSRGKLDVAARFYDLALAREPKDLLALRVGHDLAFFLGDARNLRDVVGRVRHAWSEDDELFSVVEGMHAFGLEENGDYRRAETTARAALAAEPSDVWAHHALAHVFEMEGRTVEGIEFLTGSAARWEESFFAVHNWWHLALLEIEEGTLEAALGLYDGPVRRAESPEWLDLVDAASLLWRLSLLGVDVGERAAALLPLVEDRLCDAISSFNDLHGLMICSLAGREDLVDALVAAAGSGEGSSQALVHSLVGGPLLEGFRAFGRSEYAAAVAELFSARARASMIGGSVAQRDVVDLTLLAAALRSGDQGLAAALISERVERKPSGAQGVARLAAANSG
jgi:tetratricopeptide (TPR) repeat protein